MKTLLEILYIPYRETKYKIFLKTNKLAKRLILKADPVTAQIILVKPQRTSKKKAIEFAMMLKGTDLVDKGIILAGQIFEFKFIF